MAGVCPISTFRPGQGFPRRWSRRGLQSWIKLEIKRKHMWSGHFKIAWSFAFVLYLENVSEKKYCGCSHLRWRLAMVDLCLLWHSFCGLGWLWRSIVPTQLSFQGLLLSTGSTKEPQSACCITSVKSRMLRSYPFGLQFAFSEIFFTHILLHFAVFKHGSPISCSECER